ncbi:MAG TPA: 2-hydroxyacyl-CoA dehydratase [Desulfobacterales bacterium]|nr:2-hydroxyacyl-CoA dehydratase [Desulfobacterales bacterium]
MKIGITTTIPIEIILAARLVPVDLNNLFITSASALSHVNMAERTGFAHNICAWIKGIYSVALQKKIKTLVAVVGGDCSNTLALAEVLKRRGANVIPFQYPHDRDYGKLRQEMERLARYFSVSWKDVEQTSKRLDRIRAKLRELDRLTYEAGKVTGHENHLFLVSSSDFGGDPDQFEARLDSFLSEVRARSPRKGYIRLGYLGVPPILSDLYHHVEQCGAMVVFNEIQRQFSLPFETTDIVERYLLYTYPYDTKGRIEDIQEAISQRGIEGLLHYTQTFCHRQIYDIILREELSVPILTLEGDRPGPVDGRTAFRIETFLEMLQGGTKQALY